MKSLLIDSISIYNCDCCFNSCCVQYQWKTTSMEDALNGRHPQWKMTLIEDELNESQTQLKINGERPQWKTTSMEDDINGRQPKWKTNSM